MGEKDFNKRIAECIGPWLSEGSTKSNSEITFTNNCLELIDLFYNTIKKLFRHELFNLRIYVYSKDGRIVNLPYNDCAYKYYVHKRATKPFFILRLASVRLVRQWRKIVDKYGADYNLVPYILRGFFAGEGNLYHGKKASRRLRIAQGKPHKKIENMLNSLNLIYLFNQKERSYNFTSKYNWDIFKKLKLAELHPDKKLRFNNIYNSFKETHYKNNFLENSVYKKLNKPRTSRELARVFNRSIARIQDIVMLLKKRGKINKFGIGSKVYWTNKLDIILISTLNYNYLNVLKKEMRTSDIAKEFKVCWKSSFKILKHLERLNLIRRKENGKWIKIPNKKRVIVI